MQNQNSVEHVKYKVDVLNLIEKQENVIKALKSDLVNYDGSVEKLEKENKELKILVEKYGKEIKKYKNMKFYKLSRAYWSFLKKLKGVRKNETRTR